MKDPVRVITPNPEEPEALIDREWLVTNGLAGTHRAPSQGW